MDKRLRPVIQKISGRLFGSDCDFYMWCARDWSGKTRKKFGDSLIIISVFHLILSRFVDKMYCASTVYIHLQIDQSLTITACKGLKMKTDSLYETQHCRLCVTKFWWDFFSNWAQLSFSVIYFSVIDIVHLYMVVHILVRLQY